MRFQLFKLTLRRSGRLANGFVVAPDELRAHNVVLEHEIALNRENEGYELERFDEDVPRDMQSGLESLLDQAPAGIASYCPPLGWISHCGPVPKLNLFRIDVMDGQTSFVIAPNHDVAAAVFGECVPMEEGEDQVFGVHDGTTGLSNEHLRGLPALLEFGPVGLVKFDEERGWLPA